MLTILTNAEGAVFHVTYQPDPLDVFYMRGPWRSWVRAAIVDTVLV